MAKICPNCNTYVEDMMKYCPKCEIFIQTGDEEAGSEYVRNIEETSNKKKIKNNMIFIIILTILVAIGATVYYSISCDTYKTPIKKFYSGMSKGDVSLILDSYPPFARESFKEEVGYAVEIIKADAITEIKFNIKEKTLISKEDLKLQELIYKELYNVDVKISAGYSLKGTSSLNRLGIDETKQLEHKVIKIKGKWYIWQ